jgi:SulP family sulfate permease
VDISNVDLKRMKGHEISADHIHTKMVYLTGPMFFVTKDKLNDELEKIKDAENIIFSMRAVTTIDLSTASVFKEIISLYLENNVKILFCGVQSDVKALLDRIGLSELVGEENFYWDAIGAIKSLEKYAAAEILPVKEI